MAFWKYILAFIFIKYEECSSFPQEPTISILNTIPHHEKLQELIKILEGCGLKDVQSLKRSYLKKGNATCNDGSPAGYYFRKSHGSKRWIVFLEGGWYCYDSTSCHTRWSRMKHLMSSKQWADVRNIGGLLSPNPEDNPFWWNANHVFIPYCTSDAWSGRRQAPLLVKDGTQFTFMGAIIVEQVIRELLQLGLGNASSLILAGSSAGGAGVMLNLESVQLQLQSYPNILVRGISDSGWFLDRTPYPSHEDPMASVETVKKGMIMWQGQIPQSCKKHYVSESWRCFFGYRLYPTLTAPLFVFQWLFDEAQMTADNVGAPVTKQQWDYIHKMGDSLRSTFENVTSVFAPACISHSVLTKKYWQLLRIDDVSLPQALRCWELATQDNETGLYQMHRMMADSPRNRRKHRRKHGNMRNNTKETSNNRLRKKNRRNRNKLRKNKQNGKKGKFHKGDTLRSSRQVEKGCNRKLVERCSWPQCNLSCPKLHNPFTGEEMDFIELLKSIGLDMKSVANALGMDIQTLNNMDHKELLNLLTQQAKK
nr:palmitoleoyl-protein carboxylesterase NOTUM [Halyomorpha halys]